MITLAVIAKHSPASFQSLVDLGIQYAHEVLVAVDVAPEPGILGYRDDVVQYYQRALNKHFAAQRNFLCDHAESEWILHVDTDESVSPWLWEQLNQLTFDTDVDLIVLPRANRFVGDFDTLVGWPDWQPKLHRQHVRWANAVHEWPVGFSSYVKLPENERYAIQHVKTREMQAKSDELYANIRVDANRNDDSLQCKVQDVP